MSYPTHEQHDGRGVEKSACGVDCRLEVLCQPSIAPDPREESLHDPAPRVNSEADLIRILAHDLDRDQRSVGDLLTRVSAVREDPLDEREDAPRSPQNRSAAVALPACSPDTLPPPDHP